MYVSVLLLILEESLYNRQEEKMKRKHRDYTKIVKWIFIFRKTFVGILMIGVMVWMIVSCQSKKSDSPKKNYVLYDTLIDYFNNVIIHNLSPEVTDGNIPEPNEEELANSEAFKKMFVQAFSDDSYSKLLPFNKNYVEDIFSEFYFYFTSGNYNSSFGFTYISIFIDDIEYELEPHNFASTLIHEVGHALGLGESLTTLLSDEYCRVIINGNEMTRAPDPGNWIYGLHFDLPLYQLVGAKEFWGAVFTSQKAYGELWEAHYVGVSFDDLLYAKRLKNASYYNVEMAHEFNEYGNFGLNLDNLTRVDEAYNASAAEAAKAWDSIFEIAVDNFYNWDDENSQQSFIEFIKLASDFIKTTNWPKETLIQDDRISRISK